jgi:hypothetical protein
VTASEVKLAIATLTNTARSGYDGVTTRMVKTSSPAIISMLVDILNSLAEGIFPSPWKRAITIPIYKSVTSLTWPTIDLFHYCRCLANFSLSWLTNESLTTLKTTLFLTMLSMALDVRDRVKQYSL